MVVVKERLKERALGAEQLLCQGGGPDGSDVGGVLQPKDTVCLSDEDHL